jgi:hypothetical protein
MSKSLGIFFFFFGKKFGNFLGNFFWKFFLEIFFEIFWGIFFWIFFNENAERSGATSELVEFYLAQYH